LNGVQFAAVTFVSLFVTLSSKPITSGGLDDFEDNRQLTFDAIPF